MSGSSEGDRVGGIPLDSTSGKSNTVDVGELMMIDNGECIQIDARVSLSYFTLHALCACRTCVMERRRISSQRKYWLSPLEMTGYLP